MHEIPIEDFYRPSDGDDYLPAWNRAMQSIDVPTGLLPGRIPDGRALVFGPKIYRFSDTIVINRILTIRGAHGGSRHSPTILLFPPNKTGIHVAFVYEIPDPNGRGDNTVIEKLNIVSEGGDSLDAHGLEIRAQVTVRDVRISNFPGDGLNAITEATSNTGITTNTNTSFFDRLWVEESGRHNVFIRGENANQMLFLGLNVMGAKTGWGVNDESFLGNTYIAPHSSTNAAGSYMAVGANQKAGMWLAPYAEQDQPPAVIRRPVMVIGGMGLRLDPRAPQRPARIDNSGFPLVTFSYGARAENQLGANLIEGVLGSPDVGDVAFEFRSDGDTGKEVDNQRQSGGPYRLQFDKDSKRWWLTYANNSYWSPIGFTTNTSVERGIPTLNNAYPILPRGYYLGSSPQNDNGWIKVSVQQSPFDASVPGRLGDQIYVTNPEPGGYIGWVYTTSGWRPFGKISDDPV